ncbi:proteasome subunit alpha type 1 [Pavlovales sp. CCMP2436]|nr:proteasome subunit alpha type 1 [Pavlovales sp. CCMP2436]
MFRNQYDTDCITWSPAGRIEYAMEAVKQGSAAVGLRSKTHALVASIKKSSNELSSYQKKIFKIDDHMGIAIAGLVPDGRVLAKYMRNECMNYRFTYDGPLQVGRLVAQVADKSQLGTQRAGHRPYGVGLLVAGFDQTGPHIYQTCPSGNFWEYHAFAIGSRSQAARTYLERRFESFEDLPLDELVVHALLSLRETLAAGTELSTGNVALGFVSAGSMFTLLEDDKVQPFLDMIGAAEVSGGAVAAPAAAGAMEE